MAKIKNRYLTLIIWGLFCALWNTIVLLIADLDAVKASFWTAFAFIDIAFVAVGGVILFTKLKKNDTIALHLPQYLFSAIYFGVTLLVNFLFMIFPSTDKVTFNVIVNLIIIVAFVASLIIAFMGTKGIQENEEKIRVGGKKWDLLEIQIGALANEVSDLAVIEKINELKSKVHYSDPYGNGDTAQIEAEFRDLIEQASDLIAMKASSEEIIAILTKAIQKIRIRNQMLLASK